MIRIGLISDTHGLLRPEALAALRGSDRIVHAGDIVDPDDLDTLAQIAPVTAVRGNNDKGAWAAALAESEWLDLGGVKLFVIHDLKDLDIDPAGADVQVIVSGHSHKPVVQRRDGVLYVNPGSAGPRRFKLPVSVGRLDIMGREVRAEVIELLA